VFGVEKAAMAHFNSKKRGREGKGVKWVLKKGKKENKD
jgi:hypothetical protein